MGYRPVEDRFYFVRESLAEVRVSSLRLYCIVDLHSFKKYAGNE